MAAVMNMQSAEGNALHPFFTRPNGCQTKGNDNDIPTPTNDNPASEYTEKTEEEDTNEPTKSKSKGSKSRKPKKAQGQKTLAEVLNPPAAGSAKPQEQEESRPERHVTWDDDADQGRRKRRRTNSCNAHSDDNGKAPSNASATIKSATQISDATKRQPSPHVFIPPMRAEDVLDDTTQAVAMTPLQTPPKKMMKLNAGGKLSSPGQKANEEAKQEETEPKRRGRPRKAKEPEPPKTRIVIFKYANENEAERRALFGEQIEKILSGEERLPNPAATQQKQKAARKAKSAKPTHPFFGGKPDEKSAPKQPSPRKVSSSTPGKLRSQALHDRVLEPSKDAAYAIGSALLKDRLMVKHPGAREPLWPDRTQAHVRGFDHESRPKPNLDLPSKRKRKQIAHHIDPRESLLHSFAAKLEPEPEPEQRPDGFAGPRCDLRLPNKLLISGQDVASRILPQLNAPVRGIDEDDLVSSMTPQATPHPCLQKLYSALPRHLSAFDHCSGESQGWALRYAPTAAEDVLQPGTKTGILKDWLQSLKVHTVEAASSAQPAPKATVKPKKKRRHNDDLDDFLVDDDVDLSEMNALSDPMEVDEPTGKHQLKSFVQSSHGGKVSNAVLLSGPHGCGKTAAAYAVAKELGYQIFEISSAERRSGRDVLDRVGDMTENHIVRHHGIDPGELSASEDRSHIEAAFQKDLESGRQGKMSAFFQKQPAAKPAKPKSQPVKTKTIEKLQKALKQPAKDQQQSLILLEEVDILFKEDKEFWTTVFKLLATSKRPFIMTCNDEDLIPIQAMSLHAVLRLAQPSVDSSVDLMLLIAAMEGHLLQRDAAVSLFESKNRDLRASITDLDLWCQMGVGDPKGGLNWIYQRYPPGSDVDEHGRKLRLISEGTFQDGMGVVQPGVAGDEDAMLLARREFDVGPTAIFGWTGEDDKDSSQKSLEDVPASLKDMSKLADSLSAMDLYSNCETMDPSLPDMPVKSRANYIEGMALLQSNEMISYSNTSAKLAITSTLLAYRSFCPEDMVKRALQPSNLLRCIRKAGDQEERMLTRRDFVCFDVISVPTSTSASGGLEASTFDGPLQPIATDLAPYVRSIAQYDLSLEEQRAHLGEVMGEGHKMKRARTTRAARSALEGSQRGSTRRERWFAKELDLDAVLATGGDNWPRANANAKDVDMGESSEAPASSMGSVRSASVEE